jgi:hypothetical protein
MPLNPSFGGVGFLPACLPRVARVLIAGAFVAFSASGCGSLYLHNDSTRQATANAKTELDKVDVAAVFDNEIAYLDDLQKREYAAVAEALGGQRDDLLLKILNGNAGEGGDGRTFIAKQIDGSLKGIAGRSDRGEKEKLWILINNARRDVSKELTLADALEEKRKTGGNAPPASSDVDKSALASPSGDTLDGALAAVIKGEQDLKAREAAAKLAQAELAANLKKAADGLSGGQTSQATFTQLFEKVNALIKEAREKANPYLAEYVSDTLADALDRLIDLTEIDETGASASKDEKAKAAIGFVQAAFGVGDAFSNPPRVPHPNALAATKAWLQYIAGQADSLHKEAQAKQAVLHARLDAVAQQVYYLSRAGEALEPIATKPALAKNEGLAKLLADKDPATSRAANATLYYYAAAWTQGFIPSQQLSVVTEPLVERRAKIQRNRQAGEAWMGTLKPAVATLAAYGEGGIDPHVIAELLQVLGIGAIAVGVN